jgi:hypothetical protein
MFRIATVLLVLGFAAGAQDAPKRAPERHVLRPRLLVGHRYTGSNTITYKVTTKVREGDRETASTEEVTRTERFLDHVIRAGDNGVLEIEREYQKLYTKVRDENDRPVVQQNPLQGRTVQLIERSRRRDVKVRGGGTVDQVVKRTAGLELDWRDIFSNEPVAAGDAWDADSAALARRIAPYLNIGNRSKMRVRLEEFAREEGRELAKLYVDWEVEGMRDRHLFTKLTLSGDVYFDLDLGRVTHVDLVGKLIVRGAVILRGGGTRIVKGVGPVTLQSTVRETEVVASAVPEDESGE